MGLLFLVIWSGFGLVFDPFPLYTAIVGAVICAGMTYWFGST